MINKAEFIANVMSALSNCSLYSDKHPIVKELSGKVYSSLNGFYQDGIFSITILGDRVIFNNDPVSEKGLLIDSLIKRLKKKGIEKLVIQKGVTLSEFSTLIAGLASRHDVVSSQHITVGIVEVRLSAGAQSARALAEENISRVRQVFQGVKGMETLDMNCLEDIVSGLISTLKNEANVLKAICPIRNYNEYTYVHATNVSLLTIFQSEILGLGGEMLYEIGLAALLHDIGKMFVPKEVLNKRSGLTPEEWDIMRMHPVYGARYLSTMSEMSRIAVIGAYQHHMKFDGTGYPGNSGKKITPHIVSQIIAVSDFFDALRTERPYRKAVSEDEIAAMMIKSSGRDFNPELVGIFLESLDSLSEV